MFVPIINQADSFLIAEPGLSGILGAACAEVWQGPGPGLAAGVGHREGGEKAGRRVMLAVKEGVFQRSGTSGREWAGIFERHGRGPLVPRVRQGRQGRLV